MIPEKEDRPWGSFHTFYNQGPVAAKILKVRPGNRLSLQHHQHRKETWLIVQGSGWATLDDTRIPLRPGDVVQVGLGQRHRIHASPEGLTIFEVQEAVLREDDITRHEDDHDRL